MCEVTKLGVQSDDDGAELSTGCFLPAVCEVTNFLDQWCVKCRYSGMVCDMTNLDAVGACVK